MAKAELKKLTKKQLMDKIDELEKELAEKTALAEERLNQIKYLQADFENYRKNLEREKENIIKLANENLMLELLPLFDDFENAIKQAKQEREGLEMLYRKFLKICEAHGLKQIDAVGKKFDSALHEAIEKEFSDKEEGLVLEEFQKGFMLNSKVIRPSKVKIAVKQRDESQGR